MTNSRRRYWLAGCIAGILVSSLWLFMIFIDILFNKNYTKYIYQNKHSVIIPIRIVNGMLLTPVQIGARKGWMIFDTGNPFTIVFSDRLPAAAPLTVTSKVETVTFPFWETTVAARVGVLEHLYVGNLMIKNLEIKTIDINKIGKNISSVSDDNIIGILGMNLFDKNKLILSKDYIALDNSSDDYHKYSSRINFNINRNLFIQFKIKIGDRPTNMFEADAVLDTGMGYNLPAIILHPKLMKRFRKQPEQIYVELARHRIRLQQYGIQAKDFYPSEVMISTRILAHYKVIINYPERWIALEPISQPNESLEVPIKPNSNDDGCGACCKN